MTTTKDATRATAYADAQGLLTIREAGEYLSLSRSEVYKRVKDGDIRSVHVGRAHRIAVTELDRYIAELYAERRTRKRAVS